MSVSGQLLHFGAIYLCTFSALKGLNWLYSLFVLYSSSQPFLQICLISRYVLYIYNTNKQNFEAWSINFVLHVRSNIHLLSRIYNEIRTRKWVLEKLLTLNFFFKKKHISKKLTSSSDRQNLNKMLKSYHMSWKKETLLLNLIPIAFNEELESETQIAGLFVETPNSINIICDFIIIPFRFFGKPKGIHKCYFAEYKRLDRFFVENSTLPVVDSELIIDIFKYCVNINNNLPGQRDIDISIIDSTTARIDTDVVMQESLLPRV